MIDHLLKNKCIRLSQSDFYAIIVWFKLYKKLHLNCENKKKLQFFK